MRNYQLVCCACGARYDDDGVRLTCDAVHGPALLRTAFAQRRLAPTDTDSVLRYACWLPGGRELWSGARSGVYRSVGLGRHVGLPNLWIAFSGWWPQQGATLPTASFKDLEAISVLRRLAVDETRTLVISSAGNTARAFAHLCSEYAIPALIVVPLQAWSDVLQAGPLGPTVRVVAIADAGYDDAIAFARDLCATGDFVLEGGVRNVARRDGMGTAMLAAAEAIGALPDYYVQAVGSAAGALAAYEAALRLRADGRFGTQLPRLVLSQNAPFTPIHDAWNASSPALLPRPPEVAASQLAGLGAFVLGNQAPPYAVAGGIHEALVDTRGTSYAVTNDRMRNAMALFAELEGVAIEPAAGVAVAALLAAVADGTIDRERSVLLHVTGGGRAALPIRTVGEACPTLVLDRVSLATTALDRTRSLLR